MSAPDSRPPLEAAISEFFNASALLDPMRLRIWDAEGLTVTQLRLLSWLAEEEGLSNADLADRLYVTRPSISALLDRLERGGFIRREVAPTDRRGIRIWLQPRGSEAVAQLGSDARAYARRLMEALTDDQLKSLAASLQSLVTTGREQRTRDLAVEHPQG